MMRRVVVLLVRPTLRALWVMQWLIVPLVMPMVRAACDATGDGGAGDADGEGAAGDDSGVGAAGDANGEGAAGTWAFMVGELP